MSAPSALLMIWGVIIVENAIEEKVKLLMKGGELAKEKDSILKKSQKWAQIQKK